MAIVLDLKFNGVDGSTSVVDDSASAHSSVVEGNAQLDNAQKAEGDSSIVFDGSGDNIYFTDSADWEVSTNDFEISGWFRSSAIGSLQRILDLHETGGQNTLLIGIDASGKLIASGEQGGTSWFTSIVGSTTISANTWYHFKLKRVGTTVTLLLSNSGAAYTNEGTATTSGNPTGNFRLYIGCAVGGIGWTVRSDYFSGWLDTFVFNNGSTTVDTPPVLVGGGGNFFLMF